MRGLHISECTLGSSLRHLSFFPTKRASKFEEAKERRQRVRWWKENAKMFLIIQRSGVIKDPLAFLGSEQHNISMF
jgi:hypothetical protein